LPLSLTVLWDLAKGSFLSGQFLGLSNRKSWGGFDSEISFQLSFAVLKEVTSQHCCVTAVKTNRKQLSCNFEVGILSEEANQHHPLRYSLSFCTNTILPV